MNKTEFLSQFQHFKQCYTRGGNAMTKPEFLSQFQYFTLNCPSMRESPVDSGVTLYASLGDLVRTVFSVLVQHWDQGDSPLVAKADASRDLKDQVIAIEDYFSRMQEADPSDIFIIRGHSGLDDPYGECIVDVEDPDCMWRVTSLVDYTDLPASVVFNNSSELERQKDMAEAFEELGRLRRRNEVLESEVASMHSWAKDRKEEVGANEHAKLDEIWQMLLAKSRKYDELQRGR